jgi:hypothetical protein
MTVMTTMSEHAIVSVVWLDAHAASDGWFDIDDLDVEPCSVTTIGWLIADAKPDHVTVAQSLADDGELYAVFCIPIGMVKQVVVLSPMSENTYGRASR